MSVVERCAEGCRELWADEWMGGAPKSYDEASADVWRGAAHLVRWAPWEAMESYEAEARPDERSFRDPPEWMGLRKDVPEGWAPLESGVGFGGRLVEWVAERALELLEPTLAGYGLATDRG